jgi:hypothetical protein
MDFCKELGRSVWLKASGVWWRYGAVAGSAERSGQVK